MRVLILLFSACFFIPAFGQGPISGFVAPQGELVVAVTGGQESFDTYLTGTGEEELQVNSRYYSLFAEFALADHSALVLSLPYISNDEQNRGLQDGSIWFKYRNEQHRGRTGTGAFLTAVGASLPLSRYPVDSRQAIGQRASVFHGRLLYQYGSDQGWFVQAQSGIDFQLAPEARAAVPLLLRAGWGFRYVFAETWLELYRSLETSPTSTAAAGAGSDWNRVGGTLYFPLGRSLGISLNGAWICSGNNIGRSLRWGAGLVGRL